MTPVPLACILVPMSTELVALSNAEDTFCLGVIEYAGNLPAAWRAAFPEDPSNASAKARMLLSKPEVARRIRELTEAVEEHAYISLGSHLVQLAEIRDLAKTSGQLKTALAAERSRGEVAGFYKKEDAEGREGAPSVHIHMPAGSSVSVQDWAKKNSKHEPVVLDAVSGRVIDPRMSQDNG